MLRTHHHRAIGKRLEGAYQSPSSARLRPAAWLAGIGKHENTRPVPFRGDDLIDLRIRPIQNTPV